MVILLLRYYGRKITRYFSNRSLAKIFTASAFVTVLLLVAAGVYFFLRYGFSIISQNEFLRDALLFYVLEIILVAISLLVMLSALASGLLKFFRGENDSWIIASPQFHTVAIDASLRILLNSIWPIFLIGLPAIFALNSVFGLTPAGWFFSLLALFLLPALIVSWSLTAILLVGIGLFRLDGLINAGVFSFRTIVLIFLILALAISIFSLNRITEISPADLFHPQNLELVAADPEAVTSQFYVFPSHFAARILFASLSDGVYKFIIPLLTLLALLLLPQPIFWFAIGYPAISNGRWFIILWQILREGHFQASPVRHTDKIYGKAKRGATILSRFFPVSPNFPSLRGSLAALFMKEVVLIFRDSKKLLWLGFLAFLWAIQSGFGIWAGKELAREIPDPGNFIGVVTALEFLIVIYFLSAMVLRFAFPSFSSERRTAWILACAPVALERSYFAKLFFFAGFFSILGILLGYLNTLWLGLSVPLLGASFFTFLTSIFFITLLGLSFGVIFPNFETDDPEILSTSLPGLSFIFISLIYGGAGAGALFLFLTQNRALYWIIFEVISGFVIAGLLWTSLRALRTFEFTAPVVSRPDD